MKFSLENHWVPVPKYSTPTPIAEHVSDSSSLVFVAASGGAKDHIREALLAYS